MLHTEAVGLLVGAVALGAVHGVEPGHGWPVAAAYALDQTNRWISGFVASFILGVGHLVSSLVVVGLFFYAKSYFSLTQVNRPISLDLFSTPIFIGGPVSVVAGVLLILLGVREYYGGHSHSHGTDHDHSDDEHLPDHDEPADARSHDHGRSHDDPTHDGHTDSDEGWVARLKGFLPFVGGHSHDHSHGDLDEAAERGLWGIAWFAFLLGFAHEEEFEIIALCAGSTHCLELMSAYALTVIAGIVVLTMLLIAGYESYEDRVKKYTPYLPAFSAAVLIIMGFGFITGLF